MTKEALIKDIIIGGVLVLYFVFTIRYFLQLRRNSFFSGQVKTFHLLMIWLIPFVWILLLKSLTTTTPGSHEVRNRQTSKPYSDNDDDAFKASNMGF